MGRLGSVEEDGRAATHLPWQRKGVGIWARAGGNDKWAVPPREQLTNVGCMEQLLGPEQYPIADRCRLGPHPASPSARLALQRAAPALLTPSHSSTARNAKVTCL